MFAFVGYCLGAFRGRILNIRFLETGGTLAGYPSQAGNRMRPVIKPGSERNGLDARVVVQQRCHPVASSPSGGKISTSAQATAMPVRPPPGSVSACRCRSRLQRYWMSWKLLSTSSAITKKVGELASRLSRPESDMIWIGMIVSHRFPDTWSMIIGSRFRTCPKKSTFISNVEPGDGSIETDDPEAQAAR